MRKLLLSLLPLSAILNATQLSDFVDTKKCDQVIDKQLYEICYSYKYKGALSGWVTLHGNKVNSGTGKLWNRGHFIVADADFDYSKKALAKAYTMANIQPQSAKMNQKTWVKVEKYGRSLATKLGSINSISIANYKGATKTIKNGL